MLTFDILMVHKIMQKKYFLFLTLTLLLLFSACSIYNPAEDSNESIPPPIIGNNPDEDVSESNKLAGVEEADESTTPPFVATVLHAVIVADTYDVNIGSSVEIDIGNMDTLLQAIKENTGLKINVQSISGEQFRHDNVNDVLNRLPVETNDIVIFYYSGHGVNFDNGSRWPSMVIGGGFLDLDLVVTKLKEKKPRFFLAMVDACNNFIDTVPISKGSEPTVTPKPENYQQLFFNYRGYIVASSSTPGQLSWGDSRNGGYFTQAFLNSLNKNLASDEPSWQTLMKQTGLPIYTRDPEQPTQTPQYQINVNSK
ncbi:MAG TPA: caspase family protein [Thioploca sp.]|nr:MAG: hypothetical protein DRR19_02920 [Gammaproteobacteria bacterium]HDN26575.1 caspase family protein [Thioploca sp.]